MCCRYFNYLLQIKINAGVWLLKNLVAWILRNLHTKSTHISDAYRMICCLIWLCLAGCLMTASGILVDVSVNAKLIIVIRVLHLVSEASEVCIKKQV